MSLIVSRSSGSCTDTSYALFRIGLPASSPPWVADTKVHRFDVSCSSPTAVLELVVGRVETTSNVSGSSNVLRGQEVDLSALSSMGYSTSNTLLWQELGRYYFRGGSTFTLRFDELFENLRRPNNFHQHSPAFQIRRVDSSTSVDLHANVWFEEERP